LRHSVSLTKSDEFALSGVGYYIRRVIRTI
jgi:hypothetical protein